MLRIWGSAPNPEVFRLQREGSKKDSISDDILPPSPNRALRSLLSVALSSRWAITVYHSFSLFIRT